MYDRFAELGCAGLLAIGLGLTIVDRGGGDLGAWDVCLLIAGVTALVYWRLTRHSEPAPPPEPWLRWAVFLLPAYVALQLVPLPVFLLKILSPSRAQLVNMLGSVMAAPRFASLSIAPATSAAYLLRTIGDAVVFLL